MPYKIEHEFDQEVGMHRLKVVGAPHKPIIYGDYNSYRCPAVIVYDGRRFIWFGSYWEGHVPTEIIMELKDLANNG